MTFGEIIYNLFIGPLELFFQIIFVIADKHVNNPAYAIIILSLAMNFLVLPLYRRADAVQAEEREREKKISPWVKHIKKTFKGDERFMMLQAYYREVGYKPTDSLKGSVSLLLEIPFFIAAYHFLSHLDTLKEVSFGPLADLGAPDGLISAGSLDINLLPILMTLINLVSAMLYMKGLPLKNKIQMYGIAAIFLVLLYNSPSGLVFYWTLNNLFSLIKNIFYKLKESEKILKVLCSAAGIILLILIIFVHPMPSRRAQAIAIFLILCMQIPIIPRRRFSLADAIDGKEASRVFYASTIFLALLTGALIPSQVIEDSTEEFISITNYISPYWYLVSAAVMATGMFIIWFGIFYRLASTEGRKIFSMLMAVVGVAAAIDYMFFGKTYGNFSSTFVYDTTPKPGMEDMLINAGILLIAGVIVAVIWLKKIPIIKALAYAMCMAVVIMAGMNVVGIDKNLESSAAKVKVASESEPEINLSKEGKNVVVIMMDRQIGHYIPFIMHEKPELKKSFDGFVDYHNTFSYGTFTNVGSPGLYGGYDYIPKEMNSRRDMKLVDKHDEALKVMPRMFHDEGFDVTVLDPTYAGYDWVPDLTIYDDIPGVKVGITNGKFALEELGYDKNGITRTNIRKRNIFLYSVFRISPTLLEPTIYAKGTYNRPPEKKGLVEQEIIDLKHSHGMDSYFLGPYAVLEHMEDMTEIEKNSSNTFLMISNDLTHEPMLLQEPDFIPAEDVDNSDIGAGYERRMDDEGNVLLTSSEKNLVHYQTNVAAMIKLGEWMDFLKDKGVYDNTRIIIVSDHGRDIKDNILPRIDYTNKDGEKRKLDTSFFNSVLMVKDFDSKGFRINKQLIPNADTPSIAMEGLIRNKVNPYTGKRIRTFREDKHPELVQVDIKNKDWKIDRNNGNIFLPAYWFTVKDNIYDPNNWKYLGYH